ncbi:hypothetical protein BB050_00133 [Flavobacterium anhuiense]|uniref:Lipopolysaccharide core biosynthesis protein rfaS n=1 Tax=Flavobacterium anhuiense TaxID=459526 RepID=A0AAC9CX82_9FLAO|nr:hypothetical protein [Flavobacterium anhuiense]AOC93289.1 hypothetical protein BB050_00133 [Flavobacterium anhuiense]
MKITIISHDNWGYNQNIVKALQKRGHIVNHIDFNTFKYKYPNFSYRIYNFFLKVFFKKNIKHIHFGTEINNRLEAFGQIQDIILTIKGDFIDSKKILDFKKYTKKSIAFFNDNIKRCPKIVSTISNFDEVYTFEKEDALKYNLKFITNFIYNESKLNTEGVFKYDVFNISSRDNRFRTICKIAKELKAKEISFKFIIHDKKNKLKDPNIEFIPESIQVDLVNKLVNDSKLLLDIHRKEQNGLSFRVFESLGLQKKLITTNHNIVQYDFYNPKNILIIDEKNINFDIDFFRSSYEPIPDDIYKKYTIENWVETVFNLDKQ